MPRIAAYYIPEADDPLAQAGASWLGRDAGTNDALPQPPIPGIAALTASPRRYGFHATLKAPMRLASGVGADDLVAALEWIAADIPPFPAPSLRVGLLDGFLALLEAEPSAALRALADGIVAGLDRFRAPPDEAELARRHPERLDERGRALLARYGYPYVLERWRFHMTLSERLDEAMAARLLPEAERWFAASLAAPRAIRSIALCLEAAPGADFRVIRRVSLGSA
ncbi:MAG TPA: DUF1045 domain-containing protein [Acetobacteraceae bacterium]|nr:DUF1045 domain-containing protein [Acetobacteraceae bacterium]